MKCVFEEILENDQEIYLLPFSSGDFFTLSKHLNNLSFKGKTHCKKLDCFFLFKKVLGMQNFLNEPQYNFLTSSVVQRCFLFKFKLKRQLHLKLE